MFFVVEAFGLCFDRGTWVFGGGRGVFLDGRWVCVVKEKVVFGGEDDKKNYLFIFWSEKK